MSKKIKIIMTMLLAALAAVAILFYIVSQKIDPEAVRQAAIQAIESNLNGVEASIDEVSYELGFTVKLRAANVTIKSKEDGGELFSVGHARIEAPLLAILTNGGAVEVVVERPNLTYSADADGNSNWQKALPQGSSSRDDESGGSDEATAAASDQEGETELPSFLEKSRVDFKVTDLIFRYEPFGAKPTEILLKKVLLKNINLKSTTAFEVISRVDYGIDDERSLSAKLQIVGEVGLNNLFKGGVLDSNMLVNVEDINLSWLNIKAPSVRKAIKLQGALSGPLTAGVRVSAGNLLSFSGDASMDFKEGVVSVEKLQASLTLAELSGVLDPASREALRLVDFGKSKLTVDGEVSIGFEESAFVPNLSFGISDSIRVSVAEKPVLVSAQGRYAGELLALKVRGDLMGGVGALDVNTKLNPMNLPDGLEDYQPVEAKVSVSGLQLDRAFIQKTLYGSSGSKDRPSPSEDLTVGAQDDSDEPAQIEFPPFVLDFEGRHLFIDGQEMNARGKVEGQNKEIVLTNMEATYASGTIKAKGKARVESLANMSGDFELALGSMELKGINPFLPPIISEVQGRFAGNVEGTFSKKPELAYDVSMKLRAKNGELKNLNLSSFLMPLIDGVSFLKGKVPPEKLQITDRFESFALEATATEKTIRIKKADLVGNNKNIELSAKGEVGMNETQKSEIKADLVIPDIAAEIKRQTGTREIPVLLEGNGFAILPRTKYTTDRLVERAAKKQVGVQKKKIEKKLESEKDRIKKELENKAKNLLKGFGL